MDFCKWDCLLRLNLKLIQRAEYLNYYVLVSLTINIFILVECKDHDVMLHIVAFHLGLRCLLKNSFWCSQNASIKTHYGMK